MNEYTRTRGHDFSNSPYQSPITAYWKSGGIADTWYATIPSTKRSMKYISDVYGPYESGVWPMRPVEIQSLEYSHEPGYMDIGPCYPEWGNGQRGVYPLHGRKEFDLGPQPAEMPDFGAVPAEAWTKLHKKIQSQLPSMTKGIPDMAVFLSELSDIKSLTSLLALKYSSMREIVESAAEVRLTEAFVVRPGIGDIRAILTNLFGWKKRLNNLVKGLGKVHTIKASVNFPYSNVSATQCCTQDRVTCTPGGWGQRREFLTRNLRVSVTYKYSYILNFSLDDVNSNLAVILAMFGLLPTIETAWEKVPFSFVVDWFVNTSHLLSRINLGSDSLLTIIPVDSCIATKWQETHEVSYSCPAYATQTMRRSASRYTREIGHDLVEERLPLFKLPSFQQLITGLALGVSLGMLPKRV